MANMSYCRFENTYSDLRDCYDALGDAGSVEDLEKDANDYEQSYIRKLVELCKKIAEEFGDTAEENDDEN